MEENIDLKVQELWIEVIEACNRVISHANIYGIHFSNMRPPSVHDIAKAFDKYVIPFLDDLATNSDFSPESGMKMANIKTYALHLRGITLAIESEDREKFNEYLTLLKSESMLP